MSDKVKKTQLLRYQNKCRAASARMPDYDYGQNGAYFVTICTKNKERLFGEVVEASLVETRFIASQSQGVQQYQIQYSELGILAKKYWEEIPQYFSFVTLGELIVMPNHLHGVLLFEREANLGDAMNRVSTGGGVTCGRNPMLCRNLSTVVRWYKGRVAFDGRKVNPGFAWQSRFYDHVIRNYEDLQRVSEYIMAKISPRLAARTL